MTALIRGTLFTLLPCIIPSFRGSECDCGDPSFRREQAPALLTCRGLPRLCAHWLAMTKEGTTTLPQVPPRNDGREGAKSIWLHETLYSYSFHISRAICKILQVCANCQNSFYKICTLTKITFLSTCYVYQMYTFYG